VGTNSCTKSRVSTEREMFIGVIGTRYSGKTTVVEYLKTRGFTVLKLRSGDGINDEDTSTAASSEDANENQNIVTKDVTITLNENPNAGPSVQPIILPPASEAKTLESLADLSSNISLPVCTLHPYMDLYRPNAEGRTRFARLDEEPDTRIPPPS